MTSNNLSSREPLLPGSTIGILGGGQLGRMLAVAASKLGLNTHIYCPDPESPAFDVAKYHTIAPYDDQNALKEFATSVDLVTYEFENVPTKAANLIKEQVFLAPGVNALKTSQDRLLEKKFLQELDIAISPFEPVNSPQQLLQAIKIIGTPSVLKTTRFGYDGKGQRIIKTAKGAHDAYKEFAGKQLVLEAFVEFDSEISVVIARNASGQIAAFEPSTNIHKNHILHTSTVPASIEKSTAIKAIAIATKIAECLQYQGVMAVEFFVCKADQSANNKQMLLVNEIAPRVHNSGHWTQNVCPTDQFEQHIRAICNWPLGQTERMANVVMRNLIGGEINLIPHGLSPNDHPHIYGKSHSRPGRKMGHVNTITPL
ncbi:MAG: 5-(carboxyamino)imidazole ribonucleotide synthase [Devosiaceae bacterium]|nr:5-(carboxyamino)imidazole ribonucleotide synthase [Devosiaceae bacterium]